LIRPVGQNAHLLRKPVNPLSRKYSTLPKFGIAVSIRHPGPGRGAIVRRNERGSGCGGRGCVGHARAGPGRDEPREALASVRTNGAKIPRSPFGRSRVMLRTAKSCGPGRRCYGQALRRWIGARPGLGASSIRKATVTKRNSSPGRARHKPSTHCAGKAE
jgi:hypothetical protein